jgi:hypothetical protein
MSGKRAVFLIGDTVYQEEWIPTPCPEVVTLVVLPECENPVIGMYLNSLDPPPPGWRIETVPWPFRKTAETDDVVHYTSEGIPSTPR